MFVNAASFNLESLRTNHALPDATDHPWPNISSPFRSTLLPINITS